MKNLLLLFSVALVASCTSAGSSYEPAYLGFNGKLSSVEVTVTNQIGQVYAVEVYKFDDKGRLLEKSDYASPAKTTLINKEIYTRDGNGNLVELYSGANLDDSHYIVETLWRRIEKNGNKEKWQKIDDDWWGTSYREIVYARDTKQIEEYVIQKKNGEKSNITKFTEQAHSNGTANKFDAAKYTIDGVDEHGNPLQTVDEAGVTRTYKYTYL